MKSKFKERKVQKIEGGGLAALYLSLWGPKIEAKQLVKCAMQLLEREE